MRNHSPFTDSGQTCLVSSPILSQRPTGDPGSFLLPVPWYQDLQCLENGLFLERVSASWNFLSGKFPAQEFPKPPTVLTPDYSGGLCTLVSRSLVYSICNCVLLCPSPPYQMYPNWNCLTVNWFRIPYLMNTAFLLYFPMSVCVYSVPFLSAHNFACRKSCFYVGLLTTFWDAHSSFDFAPCKGFVLPTLPL